MFSGGEVEADRTHTKWEKNTAGRLLPFPCPIGIRFQGTDGSKPFCRVFRLILKTFSQFISLNVIVNYL